MKREENILFVDEKVFGDNEEHEYNLTCYDGWAIGVPLATNEVDVPAEIIVRYPKLDNVLEKEDLASYVRKYRGLPSDEKIHCGDVMISLGKIDVRKVYVGITAHIPSDDNHLDFRIMDLYSKTSERWCALCKTPQPFLGFLKETFPLLDWVADDGDDNYGTDYVQYVSYPEGVEKGCYVLATLEASMV